MAAILRQESATVQRIYALHESQAAASAPRTYLGASVLGQACERALWYGLRWARTAPPAGRVLRLFETGHREEARVAQELRAIGVTVSTEAPDGSQWGVQACGGHLRGHLDGALLGVPESPARWHVWECKTYNTKSFRELLAKGVAAAKPVHHAQMQVYMHLTGMDRALYTAVCKDTDELYAERVRHDPEQATQLIERATRVIFAAEPPLRLSEDPEHLACRWCEHRDTCHGEQVPPATCRSCVHVTPERDGDGRWSCARHRKDLALDEQRAGCPEHRFIPALLERFAELIDSDGRDVIYRSRAHGGLWINGAPPEGLSSAEVEAASDKRALGDASEAGQMAVMLRREFGGQLVADAAPETLQVLP